MWKHYCRTRGMSLALKCALILKWKICVLFFFWYILDYHFLCMCYWSGETVQQYQIKHLFYCCVHKCIILLIISNIPLIPVQWSRGFYPQGALISRTNTPSNHHLHLSTQLCYYSDVKYCKAHTFFYGHRF